MTTRKERKQRLREKKKRGTGGSTLVPLLGDAVTPERWAKGFTVFPVAGEDGEPAFYHCLFGPDLEIQARELTPGGVVKTIGMRNKRQAKIDVIRELGWLAGPLDAVRRKPLDAELEALRMEAAETVMRLYEVSGLEARAVAAYERDTGFRGKRPPERELSVKEARTRKVLNRALEACHPHQNLVGDVLLFDRMPDVGQAVALARAMDKLIEFFGLRDQRQHRPMRLGIQEAAE
jgi:hypothetical protein